MRSCGKRAVIERGCREEAYCYCLFHVAIREEEERERTGEVVGKEYQVQQTSRVRIDLVVGIVEKRIMEIASFC